MRNLLLLLLLANVLYFVWGRFVGDSREQGVAIVDESQLGPRLQLADALPPEVESNGDELPAEDAPLGDAPANDKPAVDAPADDAQTNGAPGANKRTELAAMVGRSCVSIGPFRDAVDAEAALSEIQAEGMRASLRTTQGEVFVGHWVQIRDIPDRKTADEMLAKLKDGGLAEAHMVRTDDEGIKISLGLFGDMSGAERTELQAESMGLPAEITQRVRPATVSYVDIGLPPGRGAGSMIEKYGEDRVLLRRAATCPRSS
jgi:hypothetical protein